MFAIAHVVTIPHGQAGVPEPEVPSFLAYALADGVDPMDHALVDGDTVHVFLPPVLASKGRLLSADWSKDGRYLLVASERTDVIPSEFRSALEGRRMQPGGRSVEIFLFNSKSASAKRLHFEESKSVPKVLIEFFGNGDAAIATIANTPAGTSSVLRLTAGSSRVEGIETVMEPELAVDPTGKYIAVGASDGTVRFVPSRGQALKRQPLPNGRSVEFDRDGKAYSSPKPTEMVRIFPEGGYIPVQEPADWPYLGKTPMTGVFAYPIKVNV